MLIMKGNSMTKLTSLSRRAVGATLVLAGFAAHADDIDIYAGTTSGGIPNLLMILDNSAAADATSSYQCKDSAGNVILAVNDPSKNLGFEQCGLYAAVKSITSDSTLKNNINLGLMYFPTGGTNGGTFVEPATSAPTSLLQMNDTGISTMLTRLAALSLSKDKSNNNQIAQAMQESWAFYQGKTGLSGTTYHPDTTILGPCIKNFVLYITLATNNQKPQDSGTAGGNALQQAEGLTSLPAQLALPNWTGATGKYQGDYSDEWAKFMYTGTSPNLTTPYPPITTYTIILSDGSNPNYEQLMASMARNGGSKEFRVQLGDVQGLKDAIAQVMHDVQAVNSVFAAPVLPVSANTQGTYLNQIYMGMFRPDGQDNPRWMGNLKQYQFGVDMTDPNLPQLYLADATWVQAGAPAHPALNNGGGTGFISPTAISFWTSKNVNTLPDSKSGFWANLPQGIGAGYDSPDGEIVEKGGVAQQLRLKYLTDTYPSSSTVTTATTARNVYTCLGTGCSGNTSLSTMPFSAGNTSLTATTLGIPSGSTITVPNLINWVRGEDTYAAASDLKAGSEANTPPDSSITVRGSVHGDVLHSRPAVINYGGSTGVVVFYGANDGMFRAINGNQPANSTDSTKPLGYCTVSTTCAIPAKDAKGNNINVPPGGELWSFVPSEFYPGLQRLYQNSPALTLGSTGGTPKTYFFDGAPSVYQNTATSKAYIFLSARRGGRLLYALDVSDPANPKFLWKHSSADSGFGELGQTWSQPKVAMIKGNTNPVLIFGAGYDPNQDLEPPAADTMGRGIFILDAVSGALLWHAGPSGLTACSTAPCQLAVPAMTYSTPADITLVDRNFDGVIDRLYAADTGGNIWRVDLEPTGTGALSTWAVTQVAALGGTGTTKRKFFFPPDVVLTKTYDVLLDTTGDREHPLLNEQASSIVNRFYMIKDTKVGATAAGAAVVHDDTSDTSDSAPTALFHVTSTTGYDGSLSGFYVTLSGSGEKGVNAPTTVGGLTYFGTNQPVAPDSSVCQANLGKASSYSVNFLTGEVKSTVMDGGGLLPSPVFGIVTVPVNGQDRQLPFLIGGGGGLGPDAKSGLGAQKPKIAIKKTRRRTYWYRESDH